ncbi:MAG: AsmA-like C-terminal region-containing protein [Lysobacter sp.]|nr:AsmA-like C-terminal region-containing protein [Lysobacter sp.]
MSRPILRLLLPLSLLMTTLLGSAQVDARTMTARIARVTTAVATLEGVGVQLDWPANAQQGELTLTARRADFSDLGYRYANLTWRCPLRRDGRGGWQCMGAIRAGNGRPLQLALDLGVASTDAVLSQGRARFELHRQAATPDLTTLDLTRVPVAWAQALLSRAWKDGQLTSGTLGGQLDVTTRPNTPVRVEGRLDIAVVALETPDGRIAAEHLAGGFAIDYRTREGNSSVVLDGKLGGEILYGNTFLALGQQRIDLRIEGDTRRGSGWQLQSIRWRDGETLTGEGSAGFSADSALRDLDLQLHSSNIAPLRERYLSGWLGLFGLSDVELTGALDAHVRVQDGTLLVADTELHDVDIRDPKLRFAFDNLDGDIRYSSGAPVSSSLTWTGGELYGLKFDAATLPFASSDGSLRFRDAVAIPVFGGNLRFDNFMLRPPAGEAGMQINFGLTLDRIDFGKVSEALGLPAFRGELSGRIPNARYANDQLDFDGGLTLGLFGGRVEMTSLSMERPFGTAPTLSADIDIDDLDLLGLTEVLGFGTITGKLDGSIHDLRMVDWQAVAFDAELRTDRKQGVKQRISQRAVQNISSVGDTSFVSSLQGRAIGLFDDFGYARIGISCRLANEVCAMSGLSSVASPRSEAPGFTIVQGSGLPRLSVVGYNRQVDWPTLVERLAAVSKGDIKPVIN